VRVTGVEAVADAVAVGEVTQLLGRPQEVVLAEHQVLHGDRHARADHLRQGLVERGRRQRVGLGVVQVVHAAVQHAADGADLVGVRQAGERALHRGAPGHRHERRQVEVDVAQVHRGADARGARQLADALRVLQRRQHLVQVEGEFDEVEVQLGRQAEGGLGVEHAGGHG
jgi:hypothetical protein